MSLRTQITADLDRLYTADNLADTVIYMPPDGAEVTLLGSWAEGDPHATPATIHSGHLGLVDFIFPISQLATIEPRAQFKHDDQLWTLHKPLRPDDFSHHLILTQEKRRRPSIGTR